MILNFMLIYGEIPIDTLVDLLILIKGGKNDIKKFKISRFPLQ